MKSYNRKGKVSRLATTLLAMMFVLSSALTSFAASAEISELNDDIYEATDPVVRVFDEEGNEVEVHYFTAEDSKDVNIEYKNDVEYGKTRGIGTFNWEIRAKTRSCTVTMSMSSGTRVSVAATVRPSSSTFWMGVMLDNDGRGFYVEAKENASYTFEIEISGIYRIFVENRTSSAMTAAGSYNY